MTYIKLSKFVKQIFRNPLFSGSMVMVIGSNFANFIAYGYHVVFGRIFTESQYGELAAAFSIIGMVASAVTFLSLVVVKFVSAAKTKNDQEKYLIWFTHRGFVIGIVLCVIFVMASSMLGSFLHVEQKLALLIGPILLFSVVSLVFKSFLQAILKFKENIIVTNIEMAGRFLFGLIFVYLGFAVFGALLGLLITSIVGIIFGRLYISSYKISGKEKQHIDTKRILSYSIPILLSSLATNALISMDIVLVKHFFNPLDAGTYASVSTLGKMVFYGTAPVAAVMFPLVSKKHAQGEKYLQVFLLSLGMTFAISFGVLLGFLFIPNLVVESLFGKGKYALAGSYLFPYGIFITCFTLASVVLNFYLSIGKTRLVVVVICACLMQVAGIWLFHNALLDVIKVSIASSLFFLLSLLVYFFYETRKTNQT